MRLKNYGRNQKKRKEYIKQSGLLLVGSDFLSLFLSFYAPLNID